ncbi:Saccharopine dehydrogenase-domain-containing protein [Ephemerocybe angulata]|uniref:Saccharopine dehydrogenase-domain-containing protein n=1 Tax=Ephemerocybe angulata TaxID=980116 RepID=A0A8H6H642_9AGAR|nr:Saccharopine dehydrogenase-domain-containing protein [Tulosesus angulatus]
MLRRNVSKSKRIVLGIRREDPKRVWERRAPLTPSDVAGLLRSNADVDVVVAPCERRVFRGDEYVKAGAVVSADLGGADIVLGIKEVPLDELPPKSSATHLMFSHTHKGQAYNTPLLARFVGPNPAPHPHLIDYELLQNAAGERTVGFGWHAGVAGALEALSAMAHYHLEMGVASPFLCTPRPHSQPSLAHARKQLRDLGQLVAAHGTPAPLGPFIIGVTGSGNVARGCLAMLDELPIQHIPVSALDALVRNPGTDRRKIYVVRPQPSDYFVRTDGGAYSREHYYANPQAYKSVFHDKVAPYLTLLLHGAGWAPGFPRLMTNAQLVQALEKAQTLGGLRGLNVGDISCDIEGGLEFLTRSTTLSSPFYKVHPSSPTSTSTTSTTSNLNGPETTTKLHTTPTLPPVQLMSVDILPTALPLEASEHFSARLLPYLQALLDYPSLRTTGLVASTSASSSTSTSVSKNKDGSGKEDGRALAEALERATIARGGKLMEKHKWLQPAVDTFYAQSRATSSASATSAAPAESNLAKGETAKGESVKGQDTKKGSEGEAPRTKKRILMLGSGMVAKPAVDMIAGHTDVELVIASNSLPELQSLVKDHATVKYRVADVSDPASYVHLLEESDVVISLLPVSFHPTVGELCVKHKKHLVTASYISPAMAALDASAKSADVLLLNEIGLDPGIDHCSAIQLLASIRSQGLHIKSFTSFCGGLPAPEASDVPLRYKFSWRPQGVLSAAGNGARFLLNGELKTIPGHSLLASSFPSIPLTPSFALEGLPNRDSLTYQSTYTLPPPPALRTLLRGTLRYPGFASLMGSFQALGLLDSTHITLKGKGWADLVPAALHAKYTAANSNAGLGMKSGSRHNEIGPRIHDVLPRAALPDALDALHWLGLIPSSPLINTSRWAPSANAGMPALPKGSKEGSGTTPLDAFAALLAHKLAYAPGERDMVVLSHEIIASASPSASHSHISGDSQKSNERGRAQDTESVFTSSLIAYGDAHSSAMSRTVGLPVAIAALRVAAGHVPVRGVAGPVAHESVWGAVLEGMERVGLGMVEGRRDLVMVNGWMEVWRVLTQAGSKPGVSVGGEGRLFS